MVSNLLIYIMVFLKGKQNFQDKDKDISRRYDYLFKKFQSLISSKSVNRHEQAKVTWFVLL